jgi:blue copper oxidase
MRKDQKIIGLLLILLFGITGSSLIFLSGSFIRMPQSTPRMSQTDGEKNPLRIPAVLEDQNPDPNIMDFDLDVMSGETEIIQGVMTDTLGYNGTFLGPVLRMRRGQQINMNVENHLNVSTTIHWHGMELSGDADGGPHQQVMPGAVWQPSFYVDQPAATLWYHPHLAGTTGEQVYHGLAGLIYIEDDISDGLSIPKDYGVDDIPLIVQDRSFSADGSFSYEVTMMGLVPGDEILVNGTINAYVEVPRGLVRLRVLNGSNFENYYFQFSDGRSFHQIATDGGFLEAPVEMEALFLSPGERAEIIVDFTDTGHDLNLMIGRKPILEFQIYEHTAEFTEMPERLTEIPEIAAGENINVREFVLDSMGLRGTINGKAFDMNRIDEEIRLNDTEIWVIRNTSRMMHASGHPFHVHGTQFQIISRNGIPPNPEELGYKDTVFVDAGEEVVIQLQFKHEGLFMYHCHMLEHEDYGMMGQFIVRND